MDRRGGATGPTPTPPPVQLVGFVSISEATSSKSGVDMSTPVHPVATPLSVQWGCSGRLFCCIYGRRVHRIDRNQLTNLANQPDAIASSSRIAASRARASERRLFDSQSTITYLLTNRLQCGRGLQMLQTLMSVIMTQLMNVKSRDAGRTCNTQRRAESTQFSSSAM